VCVEITPDIDFQEDLLARVEAFWNRVESQSPPPLTDQDVKEIEDLHIKANITLWKDIHRKIKKLELEEKELREKIVDKLDHPRSKACGVSITRVERRGAVDWKKATKGMEIDEEKYRRKASVAYQFRVQDNESDEP
jgi:hypothetical protein